MNKTFIVLGLLALSFSSNGQSLIDSIDLRIPPKKIHEVIREIKLHSHLERSFFSLGESHLQSTTTSVVNAMLANEFLDGLDKAPIFCSENIATFLTSPEGEELQKRVAKTKIMRGNSPIQTDFKNCLEQNENYLTYSGFFHQFPFARSFPLEFAQTPVITEDNNSIMEQMKEANGMFISQIELDYLEMTSTNALLKTENLSISKLSNQMKHLNEQIKKIQNTMTKILDNGLPSLNKYGVFISKDQINVPLIKMPPKSYILLTELESQMVSSERFLLLSKIINLKSNELKNFINLLKSSKFYFTKDLMEPLKDGTYSSTGYGNLPRLFEGKSEFLEIKNAEKHFVIVAEKNKEQLSCFLNQDNNYVETSCDRLF